MRQLIGEDEQAVERRAQFVRHVGQELRLVLRGQGQLLGLLFQRLAGLFDFLVLAFDFLVLVGQQAGLFLQFLVGFCNSSCWLCSSWASDCDCLSRSSVRMLASMVLSTMPMRFGQLVEERLVRRVEALERGQLEDALDLAFEDDRQHEDVLRRRPRPGRSEMRM